MTMQSRLKTCGGRAALCVALACAGCASPPQGAGGAPIVYRGGGQVDVRSAPPAPAPAAPSLAPAVERSDAETLQVLPGDTLFGVSNRYGVNMRALIEANELQPPFALTPGQRLYLPPPNVHVVQRGETLYSISRRYNVDTRSLALMNDLPKPWTLIPGDLVELPALARDQGRADVAPPPLPERRNVVEAPVNAPPPLDSGAPPPKDVRGVASSAGFQWPVLGPLVKPFGRGEGGQRNDGVNIEAGLGAPIGAAADGEVVYAGDELQAFGNLLLIRHVDGWVTAYAHADTLLVGEGDAVRRGQVVAQVGATGAVGDPQLHFELRKGQQPVDPTKYLPELRTS